MKNDFIDNLQKNKEFIVTKESCKDLEKQIEDYFIPKGQEDKFNVLYFYSLINEKYQYPKDKSNILYIGHTRGQIHNGKNSLGFRFRHCCLGNDNKQNVTLMEYVHTLCQALLLEIYITKYDFAIVKSNKRYEFLMKFGSLLSQMELRTIRKNPASI